MRPGTQTYCPVIPSELGSNEGTGEGNPTMLVLHAHGGLGLAAHGIHYAIVAVGVLGLVALLAPRFLATPHAPRDEHEQRVLALRSSLTHPGLAMGNPSATSHDPTLVATQEARLPRAPVLTAAERGWLPLAVVSSTAAAGVHAAMAPEHFRETTLFGLFFAACALAQLVWAGAVAAHATRPLLVVGVVGNLLVLTLWAVTRTLGLPFGLMPGPEAVGTWDLACVAWQVVVVVSTVTVLQGRDPLPTRVGDWRLWHAALPSYVAGSVLLLVALSLSGGGA